MSDLGVYGLRSHEKKIPDRVFGASRDSIRFFLRHLWATDGSVTTRPDGSRSRVYYASNSEELARDVARLLLRLGILSRVKCSPQGEHRPMWTVDMSGAEHQSAFLRSVGCAGARHLRVVEALAALEGRTPNTNVDVVPLEVWDDIRSTMRAKGVSHRTLAAGLETQYCGSALFKSRPSRARLARVARVLDDEHLASLAESDVLWDGIVSIKSDGVEETFDALVPGTHNFVADDVVVHNSGAIEQDSDIVLFIYRDEYYNPESEQRGTAEILVAKHRAGSTGRIFMSFAPAFTAFGDLARDASIS
jgi:replicative DNA helicase